MLVALFFCFPCGFYVVDVYAFIIIPSITAFYYRYLAGNSNHPISAKRSVIQALTHRAKMVCCIPELKAKEMDYLNKVL